MLSYVANHLRKTTKVIKLQWTASIWCQKHQTTQNYKSDQITMKCMDLTSKRTKMLSYVANHSKQRKTTKVIKVQWIASIWRQNDQKCWVTSQTIQNNSNLQKYSNYNELHRFDVKNIKQRKTTKVIKLRWSAWIWRQNEQKCWVTSETIQNNANLQKLSKYNEVHGFDVKTNKNVELRRKPFKTKTIKIQWIASVKTIKMLSYVPNHSKQQQNYKSDQITMNCIDLMSKTSNNAKLQKWSNYDEVHGFDVKTNKNVELRRKPFKTTQIYKSYQSTMNCIDLMSKRKKMLSYVPNHSKHSKTTKVIKLRWIASIWRQNDQKCWVTSQTIQNNSNLQKYSNYNELHRFDVKNIKQRKTTKVIKLRRSAWIWRQNEQKCWVTSETIQNNANLQKLSKYNELHRFDVKTIKNVELRPKPFKTTQTYKSIQITMNCILMSKTSNNAKLQKWSNYDEVHGFDVKTNKNVELRRKPFKTTQIYKSYQSTMKCIDLMSKRTKMLSYVANHSKQRKSKKVIKIQWIASIWCQNDKNVELRPKPFKTTQTYKSIQITMNCIDLMSKTSNNAKLQKWSNYDEVHGFDVKTNKNVELRRKPFKTTQIYKSYQSTMNCIDLTLKR